MLKIERKYLKIKKLKATEINSFFNFFQKTVKNFFKEYPKAVKEFFLNKLYSKQNIETWLRQKTILLLVALYKKRIVGYLLAGIPSNGVVFVIWLAVDKDFQNKGIGSLLLKKFEVLAKNKGFHQVMLLVTDPRNLNFYLKNGFKIGGFFPQSYFGLNCFQIYKNIQKPSLKSFFTTHW